jgi:phosphoenolpyruvate phosphomutase
LKSTKAAAFREELFGEQVSFVMEAHNALSAKIVEETGFRAIWASGLSMSAALGVRDCNEASWTQILDVLEFMSDATNIPILVDGDTGFGNFNNARRLVRKLCDRNIAAVCIEDKLFPKTNSFLGENQPLADVDEFAGKIAACKDAQTNPDFSFIARTEALISGHGLAEALRRAERYRLAGADGIVIHSKSRTADEVLAFAAEWAGRAPLVIIPTTYHSTPTELFEEAGISMVIWANHNLRSTIKALRDCCRAIARDRSLSAIEAHLPKVSDVFSLMDQSELDLAEATYLPKH